MTKTPKCAWCDTKKGVLVLRNGAMICRPCRNDLRKYFAQEPSKPVCKRRKGPARKGRVRDKAYLQFIRLLPCVVCYSEEYAAGYLALWNIHCNPGAWKRHSATEAAHTGPRGLSQKGSDREVIPLCGIAHHREGPESYHKLGRKFFAHHGIDRGALIAELNARFQAERERAA